MSMLDGLKRQLRSVIEWNNPQPNELFHQWSDNGDEIKNASKLIVGPGQGCIFVYQGKVQSVIEKESLVQLKTANIPFWTTIEKFMQFFESEHKVGIYFFKRTKILNQKWGTKSPIKYEDPKYQFPVGLKAFGNYSYRIIDPRGFFAGVVGSHGDYTTEDFRLIMSERIIHPLTDFFAENRFSYAEIDAHREEIGFGVSDKLNADFVKLGFEMTDFRIEGTDFDEETRKRINRIADISTETQAAQSAGINFTQLQQLEAMREAARNEGGGAGAGMGLGAGIGLGQSMAQAIQGGFRTGSSSQQTNPDSVSEDITGKLTKLKKLYETNLISGQEYSSKKQELLEKF
jgi:membrane protease subunit (stomatin/prohibitin family)